MPDAVPSSSSSSKEPLMVLKGKKKRRREEIAPEFRSRTPPPAAPNLRKDPLVIPTVQDNLKWKTTAPKKSIPTTAIVGPKNKQETYDEATAAAVQALQEEASASNQKAGLVAGNDRVIAAHENTFQNETQQYQKDLETLPTELSETDGAYDRVPIAEFGAALLRGMGWQAPASNDSKSDVTSALPRPHRLGLGAIPSATIDKKRHSRRPDEFARNKAVQQQRDDYARQRREQRVLDKQQTLQNGSLVALFNDEVRGRIVKLVGVPGLNMVQVQLEMKLEPSIIKRHEIDRLLTREELEVRPFQEAKPKKSWNENGSEKRKDKDNSDTRDRKKDKKRKDDDSKNKTTKLNEKPVWVIPNIRVRIISEKLGRRYYKEKGVVVDVTPVGATVQMKLNNQILDGIPERYLETALPKVGGNAIILRGKHKLDKGQLVERDSRRAVVQAYQDMSLVKLSLDDIAEWCGPLDDDFA